MVLQVLLLALVSIGSTNAQCEPEYVGTCSQCQVDNVCNQKCFVPGEVSPTLSTGGTQLLFLFDFHEQSGDTTTDVSGYLTPIVLTMSDNRRFFWEPHLLYKDDRRDDDWMDSGTSLTKVEDALAASQSYTVELWVTPDRDNIAGPRRIVSLAASTVGTTQLFMVGQENTDLVFRVATSSSEFSSLVAAGVFATTGVLQQLTFTYDGATGLQTIYRDGSVIAQQTTSTTGLRSWPANTQLVLFNENGGGRAWQGRVHHLAMYDGALTEAQIVDRYRSMQPLPVDVCGMCNGTAAATQPTFNYPATDVVIGCPWPFSVSAAPDLPCGTHFKVFSISGLNFTEAGSPVSDGDVLPLPADVVITPTSTSVSYDYEVTNASGIPAYTSGTPGGVASNGIGPMVTGGTVYGASWGPYMGNPSVDFPAAVDGDTSTFYDSASGNDNFVGVEFTAHVSLRRIRYHARRDYGARMQDGYFEGSAVSATEGYVRLYTITTAAADRAWEQVDLTTDSPLVKWVRYVSPPGGYGNIAEMEFYRSQGPTDECAGATHDCVPSATCVDTACGWECICGPGTFGDPAVECTDVDGCAESPCDSNATCADVPAPGDGASCTCNSGFTDTGSALPGDCVDVDECLSSPCGGNATCFNFPGSFDCRCDFGFFGDGYSCVPDDDECFLETDTCLDIATCTNMLGSFSCTCPAGYTGDGVASCDDVNECEGTPPCVANAACTNTAGSFSCDCLPGYEGPSCIDIDECAGSPCATAADCDNTPGSFSCTCHDGYAGDGAACSPAPCPANADGAPACTCSPPFEGTLEWDGAAWSGSCVDPAATSGDGGSDQVVATDGNEEGGGGSSIIFAVIGILAFCCILVAVAGFLVTRKRKDSDSKLVDDEMDGQAAGMETLPPKENESSAVANAPHRPEEKEEEVAARSPPARPDAPLVQAPPSPTEATLPPAEQKDQLCKHCELALKLSELATHEANCEFRNVVPEVEPEKVSKPIGSVYDLPPICMDLGTPVTAAMWWGVPQKQALMAPIDGPSHRYDNLAKLLPPTDLSFDMFKNTKRETSVACALLDSVPTSQRGAVSEALAAVCSDDEVIAILKECILDEIQTTATKETLFRTDSPATKLFGICATSRGVAYIRKCVGPETQQCIAEAAEEGYHGKGQSVDRLAFRCQKLVEATFRSKSSMPSWMVDVLQFVHTRTEMAFPGCGGQAMGGFLFLRMLLPALSAPESFFLVNDVPGKDERAYLVDTSKVLLSLANGVEFKAKHGEMVRLNAFLTYNQEPLRAFWQDLMDLEVCEDDEPSLPVPPEARFNALKLLHTQLDACKDSVLSSVPSSTKQALEVELASLSSP